MEIDKIRERLATAMKTFEEEGNFYLLEENLNERTISHQFAMHLQRAFKDYNVDCEYNRAEGRPKQLRIPQENVSWEDTEAKTVFPDIIVHRRGRDTNILVVEMKKSGRNVNFDEEKLRAYCTDHKYCEAVLLKVRTGKNPGFENPQYYKNR